MPVGIKFVLIQLKLSIYLYFLFSSFPHATDETLLAKFKQQHQGNKYFVPTPVLEPAFVIRHFAGKVKYQIKVSRKMDREATGNMTIADSIKCKQKTFGF